MPMNRKKWITVLGTAVLVVALAEAQKADPAELMIEAAARKERVDGDLKGAIEQYRKIAAQFARQPDVAAQALLKMGQCQEKLGQADARKSYERIVRDYAGAGQYTAAAKARLAALGSGGAAEPAARLVWDNAVDLWGTVSADGRYLSFVDWSTGDLAIRDLQTGENRRLTDKGGYDKALGEAEANTISPDGKRVAFGWDRWDPAKTEGSYELRVIGTDGKGEKVLHRTKGYLEPQGWSPDGKWIAVAVQAPLQKETEVMLISTEDGKAKVLPESRKQWKQRITFSPDGQWLAYSSETTQGSGKYILYTLRADGSGAAEAEAAVDARMVGWTPDGSGILFARQREGADSVYVLPVSQGKPTGEARLIRTAPLPAGKSMGVTPRGTLIYGSQNVQMEAWVSEIDARTGRLGRRLLQFPAQRIGNLMFSSGLKFSPDGKEFLCGVPHQGILIHSMATGAERTIMPQLAQMSRAEWSPDGGSLLILGVGNDGKEGQYRVDLRTGVATLLAASLPALSWWEVVSLGDGKTFYYKNKEGAIVAREVISGSERILIGQSEKAPRNEIRFSHDGKRLALRGSNYLGVFDLATGQLKDLYRGKGETAGAFSGSDWSADDRYLVTLVRLDFAGRARSEIRSFPVDGGEPARFATPVELRGLSLSPDGKHAGSVSYASHAQVWALENFLPGKK